jgi:hypothetical protein
VYERKREGKKRQDKERERERESLLPKKEVANMDVNVSYSSLTLT